MSEHSFQFRCLVATVALAVGACGAAQADDPAEVVTLGIDGAWSFRAEADDHIVRDGNGTYLCVLRRSTDLADLRAQFNRPGEE